MPRKRLLKTLMLRLTTPIPVRDNGTPMVKLNPHILRLAYIKPDMIPLVGTAMYIRKTVAEKLYKIQSKLVKQKPYFQLWVAYAYRTPEIQRAYFLKRLNEVKRRYPFLTKTAQIEKAHAMSAHPKTAGHPTGGAVDITLWDKIKKREVDMGSRIAQFGEIATTYYPHLTKQQRANRLLLLKLMTAERFAPFFLEWWHFSYGDKEWAFYYRMPHAFYKPIMFNKLKKTTA